MYSGERDWKSIRERLRRPVKVLVTGSLTLWEKIQITWNLLFYVFIDCHIPSCFFGLFSLLCVCCFFCILLSSSVFYVFLLLCILCSMCSVFVVPTDILRLPWLRFSCAFSSVIKQMPGYNSQRRGTNPHSSKLVNCVFRLCCCMYRLCVNVYCTTATECQPNCS